MGVIIMADSPSVLFVSCSEFDPEEIIKLVLNVSELPERVQVDNGISAFPWKIDNKYYTAEVRLCSLKEKRLSNKKFADSVEAVVVFFDSLKKYALDEVDSWMPFINEFQQEIKILVCKNIQSENDDSSLLCKRDVQGWCISKGFELVELEPVVDNVNDDLEDDFQETTGVKRIIQALNAHVWPNLVMKNTSQKPSPLLKLHERSEINNLREQLHLEESLEELLDKDEDFSQLFSQLSEMKERISNLSGSERKAAAEQVVKAFWKALNDGEDDEIFDL